MEKKTGIPQGGLSESYLTDHAIGSLPYASHPDLAIGALPYESPQIVDGGLIEDAMGSCDTTGDGNGQGMWARDVLMRSKEV